jgi:hypothetical protein
MSKKKFNPKEWEKPASVPTVPIVPSNNPSTDIEVITQRIEATATDIAPNYADWRDLGFALADALGEIGRSYYHRLSRFYAGYTPKETDSQYSKCLKAHGHGVTIKTLYHLAKSAGVDVSTTKVPQISKLSNCQFQNRKPKNRKRKFCPLFPKTSIPFCLISCDKLPNTQTPAKMPTCFCLAR